MDTRQKSLYLAQRRYERYLRALGLLFWLPMDARTGAIASNAAYGAGESAGIFSNAEAPFTFTADNPTGWTTVLEGATTEISEVGSGEGHGDSGAGYVNLWKNAADPGPQITQGGLVIGDTYRLKVDFDTVNGADGLQPCYDNGALIGLEMDGPGLQPVDFIATRTAAGIKGITASTDTDNTLALLQAYKIGELDALIGGTTSLAQGGHMGASHALLLDGATSLLTITNRAAIQGLDAFSLWMLFRPTNAGEGNAGTLFEKTGEWNLRFLDAGGALAASVVYDTTNASTITSTTLAYNQWHSVGLRLDDSSKQIAIFIDGVEASYASQTAGVGTRASTTNNLIVGNNNAVSRTLSGLVDEALMAGRALSDSEWQQLHRLAGLD